MLLFAKTWEDAAQSVVHILPATACLQTLTVNRLGTGTEP